MASRPYINSHWSYPGVYSNGDNIDISLNFTQNILVNTAKDASGNTVTGNPVLALRVGTKIRNAEYTSGSGTSDLLFRYTVQADDLDRGGVTIKDASGLDLSGGSLLNAWNVTPDTNLTRAGLNLTNGDNLGALLTKWNTLLGGMTNISAAGGQSIHNLSTSSTSGSGAILSVVTLPSPLKAATSLSNITKNLTGATDNIYTNIGHTGGTGSGATFDIDVSGGLVVDISTNAVGGGYKVDDILTIDKTNIGGGSGTNLQVTLTADDMKIIDNAVSNVRATTAGSGYRAQSTLSVFRNDISGATGNLVFTLDSYDIGGIIVEGAPIFSTSGIT